MSPQIKIKVRPNEVIRFPNTCINCSRPASDSMKLSRRDGRVARQVDVPLCDQCAGQLQRESREEERLRKLSSLIITTAGILAAILLLFLLPSGMGFGLRLILALIGAVLIALFIRVLLQGLIQRAALPEKKAIWGSAHMESFSWRTTTFVFSNESFVECFNELNKSLLVEN